MGKKTDKIYKYKYPFSKIAFLEECKKIYTAQASGYIFDEKNFSFGIERGGHGSGYWFSPQIIEKDDGLYIEGEINCISCALAERVNRTKTQKFKDIFITILFGIIFSPILLIYYLVRGLDWCIYKIFRKTKPYRLMNRREKLDDLMINILNCKKLSSD